MAKRELISREEALSHPFANGKYDHKNADINFILGHESYKEWLETLPVFTEQEIVKPYLEKLKEQIAKSADKQLKIAMGTADLNERYAHIRVESAFRQCIAMIDNLLSEQETWI